jgi:ABC-type transport system substrate-binding protein
MKRRFSPMPAFAKGLGLVLSLILFGAIVTGIMNKKIYSKQQINVVLTGAVELPLAPENISSIPLYQIHANLWGTLLRNGGKEGLARLTSRSEDGKRLTLELLPGANFSNGRPINASDVLFSFQRLVGRQSKGHFNAKGVIKSIRAVTPSSVEIEAYQPTPALSFLLSIPEMGIVPPEACDKNGDLIDLKITSGAYRIETPPTTDNVVLTKNENYPFHEKDSPASVSITFRRGKEALQKAFRDENADFIEIYEGAGIEAVQELKSEPDAQIFSTKPSYSSFLVNKSTRMGKATKRALARLIHDKYNPALKPDIEHRSYEILPPRTFGTLNASEPAIEASDYKAHLPKQVTLRFLGARSAFGEELILILKNAGIEVTLAESDGPSVDLESRGQGMNADFPEIEFFLNMVSPYAFIPASEAEKLMIEKMLHTTDTKERASKIRSLGRSLLEDGRVIPLFLRSYVHVYRKGVVANGAEATDYDGDVLFYRMRLVP